ncbi:MAG: DegT/DnrJ/EryC1/StrS family aminotransferase [Elusimicrobia bacterium]|nr:DegT/DnrJ/EryC1/StrS family aminotransferase [Elusimicrobiota bacterium]
MTQAATLVKSRLEGGQYRVRFVNPQEHYRRLKAEIDGAIFDCLENGDLIHRKQLFDFEKNLAAYAGTKYAVGVNSGYHALLFSLIAKNIGPGDEVITVGHTFAATVSAIVHCGAVPILVDVAKDFNMDPEKLEAAITSKTKAVIPVHLNGRVCPMDEIMRLAQKHNLAVVEDAAQALGAIFQGTMGGAFGDAGCFSFYPFKALGGFGDGGAVTTNDPDVARIVTLLRYNGEDRDTGEFYYHGQTALLDNVQAAVLDVKLRHFPFWVAHRRRLARLYQEDLADVKEVALPHFLGQEHQDSYQNYVIRTERRDDLRSHLKDSGIETLVSWPTPMWHHKGLNLGPWNLPETESICREALSLPMNAEVTEEDVGIIARAVRDFFN